MALYRIDYSFSESEYYTVSGSFGHIKHWLDSFQLCFEPFPGPCCHLVRELTERFDKDVAVDPSLDAFGPDAIKYWRIADIVVTNPPFNLLQEFFKKCLKHQKPFICVCPCYMFSNIEYSIYSKFENMYLVASTFRKYL